MISGVINKMWTKDVEIKRGPRAGKTAQVHLFSLEDDDRVYSLAFGTPEVKVGDSISFHAEEKYGEHQVDKSTMKVASRGNTTTPPAESAPTPAPKNTGSGGGKGGYSRGNFPLDFTDGQRSILRQHAFTQASEILREYYRGSEYRSDLDEHFVTPDEVVDYAVDLAYKIEKYTSGDDLRAEMKED